MLNTSLRVGERPPQAQAPPEAKKPRLAVRTESAAQRSDGSAYEARGAPQRRDPSPESPVSPVYIANGHGMPSQSEYAKNRPRRQVRRLEGTKADQSDSASLFPEGSTCWKVLKQALSA